MADSEYARRATLAVTLDGCDISGDFAPYLLDFTYTDNASGKADEVQLTLHNRDGRFSGEWMPKKGMPIEALIVCTDWSEPGDNIELPCGMFKIDEIEFSGPPDKVSIKAVSADLTGPLRDTRKTRAWENMNLEGVAAQIAGENGLEVYYSGPEHRFERQDQRSEGDIAFLNRLCSERSMNCKVHNGKIAVFDADEAESAEASLIIPKTGEMYSPKSYNFKVSSAGTDYADAEVAYSDPKTGTAHKARVKSNKKTRAVDGNKKTLTVRKRVEDPAQAAELGKSELHAANVKERTASVEIMGCPLLAAGQMVVLDDFGEFSGDYFIKTATHKVSGSGVYSTSLELTTPAPTETETAHEERSEAALAARAEMRQNAIAARNRDADMQAKTGFADLLKRLPDILTPVEELLLCLPAIAAAEAERALDLNDRQGWLHLEKMFYRWFGNKSDNTEAAPYWVDWDWLMQSSVARKTYDELRENFLNEKAKDILVRILAREGYLTNERREFNFILDYPDKFKELSHQYRNGNMYDSFFESQYGYAASLGNFTLYGLASGYVEPLPHGHRIHVTKGAAALLDSFDFNEDQFLGIWSCAQNKFLGWEIDPYTKNILKNEDFRNFRAAHGNGLDFLVVTSPHNIEPFQEVVYDTSL